VRRRLALLHNVREEGSLSMKLYAERLAAAVDDRWEVQHVRPWGGLAAWPTPSVLGKGLEYAARYMVYPLSLAGRRRGDVFHVVDHAYAHLVACLPATRTVVTCHDLMLLKLARGDFGARGPVPRVALALLTFATRFLGRAARVIAVSQAAAEDLVRHIGLPRERIAIIPHGVDPMLGLSPDSNARAKARARLGLESHPVLLHVGNHWFYKNLEGVLSALARLRGSNGKAPLLVKAGDRLTPSQHALARALGVEDRVLEVGHVPFEELRALYWAADVLVYPSLWEGFGWPVLEAMACGTPVVCSDRGALGEVGGEGVAVVDPDKPGEIADAVERVLSDGEYRRRLVEAGLERARKFTWERAGAELCEVYEAVAAGAAR
jgi:glycosyltransferase involved in cell wall biosynthesis